MKLLTDQNLFPRVFKLYFVQYSWQKECKTNLELGFFEMIYPFPIYLFVSEL